MAYAAFVEKTIPVSRSRVFAALMDFGAIARLVPDAIETCRVEGSGIGALRHFRLKGDSQEITERLECACDERVFSYSVITPNSLQLDHYHAVVVLSDAPDGGCHVAWGSNWISRVTPAADIQVGLVELYTGLIDAIAREAR